MKKPVINYGWKIKKRYIFLTIIGIILAAIFAFTYNDKTDASYIAKQLSLYTRLNITEVENVKDENINEDILYGLITKCNLYSEDFDSINNYVGSIEVYKNESLSRIRRTTLKHSNKYILEKIKDKNYVSNRTYNIYLYNNIIIKLNKNYKNQEEFLEDFEKIIENVKLDNQRTLNARETEEKVKEINLLLEKEIDKDYKKFSKNPEFFEL